MSSVASPEFGKLRSMLCPLHRNEFRKFLPMLVLFALIVFNYSILKAAKDALVVTAPESGAEAIPFIKFWAILPMAIFFTYIFTRLSNRYSREKVFYMLMILFLGYFLVFATVLYPLRDVLHPHGLADQLQASLPKGFQGLISIFRNWTFTLFYVMSELWGTTIMTVLFWGFANEISTVSDAKRFYAILGIGANLTTILSGKVSVFLSKDFGILPFMPATDAWGQSLLFLTLLVIISGIIAMGVYRYMHKKVLTQDPSLSTYRKKKSKKIKMGIRENFAYLAKSKYLIRIALIVLTYNIALNMVEIVWKDQVRLLYPNPSEFNAYMGNVMIAIGITSTIVSVFLCGPIIRKFGWTISALVSPMILLITGVMFFTFVLFKDTKLALAASALFSTTPLILSTFFGSMQNCFSRASKFTFFDSTKEMAFIPLSDECKQKGKAAIDGVGSRMGKSGGSIIHQCLLLVFGTVSLSTPFIAVILFGVVFGWIFSVRSLGRKFTAITATDEKIDLDDDSKPPGGEHPSVLKEQKAY